MVSVIPMKPTTDKRARLQVVAPHFKNRTFFFPEQAASSRSGRPLIFVRIVITICAMGLRLIYIA